MSFRGGYSLCATMDVMIDAVRVEMRQVSALGKTPAGGLVGIDPRFNRGQDFLQKHDSWFAPPLYGESCVNAVAEGQSVLSGLQALLQEYSVSPITDDIRPTVTPDGPLDALKPVITGLAVIAGVVMLFPIVQEVLGARRASRRLAGRNRSRR